ncbi:hypothetical protein TNCV_3357991 [Trichonephila clavipes]|nr:hypothetical protein TNCV_3357991 [Trichonephila clavipes]
MSRCWTRNYGALGQTARVCFGVLRTNRTRRRERKKETRERGAGLGWRKEKSPALDGEGVRGEPWLERTGNES